MTPDALKGLFDTYALILMSVWGLLCVKLPALKAIPNKTIPYVNVAVYILTKLSTGTAFAACKDCPPEQVPVVAAGISAGLLGVGGLNAILQSLLWDKFIRPVVEKVSPKV